MRHALVIGGTGMLADASLYLADQGYRVSVIARNPERMEQLISRSRYPERLMPVLVDYSESAAFRTALATIIRAYGPIEVVVTWVHSYAFEALPAMVHILSADRQEWTLFHVLGSSTRLSEIRQELTVPENCRYIPVQLGFVVEGDASRWLTDREIAEGVIRAIREGKPQVVGTLEPWDRRP